MLVHSVASEAKFSSHLPFFLEKNSKKEKEKNSTQLVSLRVYSGDPAVLIIGFKLHQMMNVFWPVALFFYSRVFPLLSRCRVQPQMS